MHYGSFRKQRVKYKACIFWHIFMAPRTFHSYLSCLSCVCVCYDEIPSMYGDGRGGLYIHKPARALLLLQSCDGGERMRKGCPETLRGCSPLSLSFLKKRKLWMIFSYFLVYLLMEEMCDFLFHYLWKFISGLVKRLYIGFFRKDRMVRMRESGTGMFGKRGLACRGFLMTKPSTKPPHLLQMDEFLPLRS